MAQRHRFYLHIKDDLQLVQDRVGISFASVDDARAYAVEGMRDMICEALRTGTWLAVEAVEVADESGFVVATITQTDALYGIIDLSS